MDTSNHVANSEKTLQESSGKQVYSPGHSWEASREASCATPAARLTPGSQRWAEQSSTLLHSEL